MELSVKILLANAGATLFLVGLIWVIQVVHYPMFADVGRDKYQDYQRKHERLITYVVALPMLVEVFTTVLLAWYQPPGARLSLIVAGIVLVLIIWASTAALQVPCHAKLASGFDVDVHRRLVMTNWIRTFAWSARGMIVILMMYQVMTGRIIES